MFNQKKSSLFETKAKNTSAPKSGDFTVSDAANSNSAFVKAAVKGKAQKQAQALSGNGALKYSTTGNDFVDQFATASQYKAPRSYNDVAADMQKLWSKSPLLTIMFTIYLRLITRKVQYLDGSKTEEVQKGQGLKSEGIMRMIWIHTQAPDSFWKNIALFVIAGSWKDIFQMLNLDLQYHGWEGKKLDWNKFGHLILSGLENPNVRQLILKYLPQIKANSACTTLESQANNIIGKWICSLLFGGKLETFKNYRKYRKLKSSGTAHEWQQLISQKQFDRISFDSIHGRALLKLVKGKFLKNSGQETRYSAWIGNKAKNGEVAKFTGWVAELYREVLLAGQNTIKRQTYDAQYLTLLELAKVNTLDSPYRAIAVVDVSGSMNSMVYVGKNQVGKFSSADVARSSAIILDDMLESSIFKGYYLEFNNNCDMFPIHGKTFSEKVDSIRKRDVVGGTNFLSVFDLFIKLRRQNPSISEKEFPNMVVVLSDGQFNHALGHQTNIEAARVRLIQAGFSKEYAENFGFCFVDIPNGYYGASTPKFETFGNTKNCFYFSGFDLSPLGFLLGMSKTPEKSVPTTPSELFDAAMNQEILSKVIQ